MFICSSSMVKVASEYRGGFQKRFKNLSNAKPLVTCCYDPEPRDLSLLTVSKFRGTAPH
jgi:hypothetical protein